MGEIMEKSKGQSTVERLLEEAKKSVDAAEIFYIDTTTEQVEFKFDTLHLMETKNIQGLGLRVIKDGKIGFASCTTPDAYKSTLTNAIASTNSVNWQS